MSDANMSFIGSSPVYCKVFDYEIKILSVGLAADFL